MNISFFVTFNENLMSLWLTQQSTSVSAYFACAAVFGSLAAILTTPFDVVKIRMQTQATLSSLCKQGNKPWTRPVYCSTKAAVKKTLAEEVYRGFTLEAVPRMLHYLPREAVSWTTSTLGGT